MHSRAERQLANDGVAILHPLSWLYRGGVALARARRAGKPARARPRVVSVGNLTVGGSGKTPLALLLVERALAAGVKVAYASRGFAGAAERGAHVTWVPGENTGAPPTFAGLRVIARHSGDLAARVGDEAAMVAQRAPGADLLVARDKRRAIDAAAAMALDIVVVDDAFQSFVLARHVDVVMLDARSPLGNRRLLPAGPLREPPSALGRADVLVFNGAADMALVEDARQRVAAYLRAGQRVYGLRRSITLVPMTPVAHERPLEALLVAGIARPKDFEASVAGVGATTEMLAFRDHHRYNERDARRICEQAGTRAIVTTEKDWVKLSGFDWGDRAVWVARLDVDLVGENDVDAWLLP